MKDGRAFFMLYQKMNTMKLENKLKRKEVIPNNEVRKESEMKTGIGDNEVFNEVFSKSFSSSSKRRCYHRSMVKMCMMQFGAFRW